MSEDLIEVVADLRKQVEALTAQIAATQTGQQQQKPADISRSEWEKLDAKGSTEFFKSGGQVKDI